VMVIDREGRLEYVNARFEYVTGLNRSDLVDQGRYVDPFCEPSQGGLLEPGHVCGLDGIRKTGEPVQFIHFQLGEGSEQAYFRVIVSPLFDEEGQIDRIVETARPITETVLRTREIEESEMRFRQFVDNAHDMITMKDIDGRYLVVNKQAAALLGMSPMDCIGRTDYEILPGGWPIFWWTRTRTRSPRASTAHTGKIFR